MHEHGLTWGPLTLALALLAGCPADTDADTDSGASSTGAAASTGVNPTGDATGAGGSGSTNPTGGETTSGPVGTTSGIGTSGGVAESSSGGGESGSSSSGGGESSSSGEEPETTGPLEEYACNGYWFAACSFCLQTECMPELTACEGIDGCCCLSYCIAGGLDAELCMLECGVEQYPAAADELMACKVGECAAGGQCPKD